MQASEVRGITPPFQKSAQLRIPPHQLNTTPCPHSNTKVFTTVENEPLGDITLSDVRDVAANNNTKQLFTEVVPRRKVARLTMRFYTFPPYILFKRRQDTRQFYILRNSAGLGWVVCACLNLSQVCPFSFPEPVVSWFVTN